MQSVKITLRDIDRLIAERVMGWTNLSVTGSRFGTTPDGKPHRIIPQYSTEISAAWEIVEKLRLSGYQGGLEWAKPEPGYECAFGSLPFPLDEKQFSWAETAPLAICLAALKVMEVPIELGV
jgi:hypothetical protein